MTPKFRIAACAALAFGCLAVAQQTSTVPAGQPQQPPAPAAPPKPAPAPAASDANDEIDGGGSVAFFYWYGPSHPTMRSGKDHLSIADPSDWTYPGNSKPAPGGIVSFPAGKNNALRFYYTRIQGNGNGTVPYDINLYNANYPAGAYLSSSYTLQNLKVQLDYLTWPFPVKDASFRLKTLWEFQYVTMKSTFNAPLILDTSSTGFAPIFSSNKSTLIYPSFGIGLEKRFSKNFRWEGRGSGFAWPGKANIWDGDTFFAIKGGQFEVLIGGKAFHFKTSPNKTEYVQGTWAGGYVGLRWYPRW